VTETLQGFGVGGFLAVQFCTTEEHLAQTKDHGGMGIAFAFTFGVVLAVNRNPFFGDHTGGHPEPETEEMHQRRVQV
jgi:hypothetical protein